MACLVWIPLNAAQYKSPLSNYLKQYFGIIKLWIIPFCVSSISIGCNIVPNECNLTFPTDTTLLLVHIAGMIGIIVIGCIIHYILLPICDNGERLSDTDQDYVIDESDEDKCNERR